ncbi:MULTISPECIES: hypothetical protein [Metabacillus]|uniref:Uncharacterized protein n=1 Tax=Metabacillus endolithicus TaxID=1535204 RepID=A0ABW5C2Z7_9BACI|nr:hypothetical protein [Metabacillus endolithicus]UPG61955.1 hypothetical protein MVE64_15250 [Metabacillus endolithicus]
MKTIINIPLKIVGILLIILGQGIIVITSVAGWLMYIITAFLFFSAIAMSFTDLDLGSKIAFWVLAIIFGAISTNIYALPLYLVSAGKHLIEFDSI